MTSKEKILKIAQKQGEVTSSQIASSLNISRQTAAHHLSQLVQAGKLQKSGSTRSATYSYFKKKRLLDNKELTLKKKLKGLEEHRVFDELLLRLPLKKTTTQSTLDILSYAFTEMLNNAIDHSKTNSATITFNLDTKMAKFTIQDSGIGTFESIRKKFKFSDHFEAIEHLMKGKQTTAPEQHSGQGIFFTSKIADYFSIQSGKIKLIVDNQKDDIFLEELKRSQKGTTVYFEIKKKSRKSLKALFDAFSGDDFEFDKSIVTVHLSQRPGSHVSRSEAKRLLFGLDKFKRILFDFKKVRAIGQGFSDEIFRVFAKQHPHIKLETTNMNASVTFMIKLSKKH